MYVDDAMAQNAFCMCAFPFFRVFYLFVVFVFICISNVVIAFGLFFYGWRFGFLLTLMQFFDFICKNYRTKYSIAFQHDR